MAQQPFILKGTKDQYTLIDSINAGGCGITYKAIKMSNGNLVAVKTLNNTVRQLPNFKDFQTRFINEALAVSKCTHPHIVKVEEVCQDQQGYWYMVMEYIHGGNLIDYITHKNMLNEEEALTIIQQIGSALSHVHSQGLQHRDIKPHNILLRSKNPLNAVLIDFGIAKDLTIADNKLKSNTFELSGTHYFAPIEQYKKYFPKTIVSPASDVYSLAVTLYVIVTSEYPYPADIRYQSEVIAKMPLPIIPPKNYNPQISDRLNTAILEGLKLLPHERPQTVQSWLDNLLPPPQPGIELKTNKADFHKLNQYLYQEKWQEADKETDKLMLKIANREKEGWLDIDSCQEFPLEELQIINNLWEKHSNGHFSLNFQKKIFMEEGGIPEIGYSDQNWSAYVKMSYRIGWKKNEEWMSYPSQFIFSKKSPQGHLPSLLMWLVGLRYCTSLFSRLPSNP